MDVWYLGLVKHKNWKPITGCRSFKFKASKVREESNCKDRLLFPCSMVGNCTEWRPVANMHYEMPLQGIIEVVFIKRNDTPVMQSSTLYHDSLQAHLRLGNGHSSKYCK